MAPPPGLPSSTEPSQLLSAASQTSADGVPCTQLSTKTPSIHDSNPADVHSPTPHCVGIGLFTIQISKSTRHCCGSLLTSSRHI